jgi:hypothetical protein
VLHIDRPRIIVVTAVIQEYLDGVAGCAMAPRTPAQVRWCDFRQRLS